MAELSSIHLSCASQQYYFSELKTRDASEISPLTAPIYEQLISIGVTNQNLLKQVLSTQRFSTCSEQLDFALRVNQELIDKGSSYRLSVHILDANAKNLDRESMKAYPGDKAQLFWGELNATKDELVGGGVAIGEWVTEPECHTLVQPDQPRKCIMRLNSVASVADDEISLSSGDIDELVKHDDLLSQAINQIVPNEDKQQAIVRKLLTPELSAKVWKGGVNPFTFIGSTPSQYYGQRTEELSPVRCKSALQQKLVSKQRQESVEDDPEYCRPSIPKKSREKNEVLAEDESATIAKKEALDVDIQDNCKTLVEKDDKSREIQPIKEQFDEKATEFISTFVEQLRLVAEETEQKTANNDSMSFKSAVPSFYGGITTDDCRTYSHMHTNQNAWSNYVPLPAIASSERLLAPNLEMRKELRFVALIIYKSFLYEFKQNLRQLQHLSQHNLADSNKLSERQIVLTEQIKAVRKGLVKLNAECGDGLLNRMLGRNNAASVNRITSLPTMYSYGVFEPAAESKRQTQHFHHNGSASQWLDSRKTRVDRAATLPCETIKQNEQSSFEILTPLPEKVEPFEVSWLDNEKGANATGDANDVMPLRSARKRAPFTEQSEAYESLAKRHKS
ncbi:hypothetical protein JQC92_10060 [Shewanella sp. 202IG2-18]|uniref:hypothetical protein n=1 Tax=Parashewanella hymeniacidonis TaxID=2807618 RepID=UPI00195F8538|nr:hypothetical protein [Parashewanella hymeniacidonis]MBM7072372.1 hypothetical protein [Parashewanella hymeniacidonis]